MSRFLQICWGYAIEAALASAFYGGTAWVLGGGNVAGFFKKTWIAWSTVCGLVFAAAVAMLVLVVQMMTSEFGGYLSSRSADLVFKKAFAFAVGVAFFGVVAFVIAGNIGGLLMSHVAAALLFLTVVNLYTMVKNIFILQRLHALFERIRRRETQRDEADPSNGGPR